MVPEPDARPAADADRRTRVPDQGAVLGVVVVTPSTFRQIRRTVEHLRLQADVDRIELILVAPDAAALADADPRELAPFGRVTRVEVGPIDNVDRAAARGMLRTTAPIVATIEDHAFVRAGWVGAILGAYDGQDWASVGSVMGNANPRRSLSWANLLLGYGWWIQRAQAGEHDDVPSHNATYRRSALDRFGDALPAHVGRAGDLHDRLRDAGERMLLHEDAAIDHVNPSATRATAELRFQAGRLYGAMRREQHGWGLARRWVYALASPLIPLVRLRRFHAEQFAPGQEHAGLFPRVLPGLVAALVFDAAGQAAGYLRGPGTAPEVLATFEMDRLQHLDARDRAAFAFPPPPRAADAISALS
jgi:hypothetical protein